VQPAAKTPSKSAAASKDKKDKPTSAKTGGATKGGSNKPGKKEEPPKAIVAKTEDQVQPETRTPQTRRSPPFTVRMPYQPPFRPVLADRDRGGRKALAKTCAHYRNLRIQLRGRRQKPLRGM
jgi:hypothetical protein